MPHYSSSSLHVTHTSALTLAFSIGDTLQEGWSSATDDVLWHI